MLTPTENDCLIECQACATACLQCAQACLREEDAKAMARCIALDIECADMCRLAATSIARGDRHMKEVCTLCAQVCQDCEVECFRHPMDHCQQCAHACQRCADACRRMAKA